MCGIAGIVYQKSDLDPKDIVKMTDLIFHRGPDDFGHYYDRNVALGHRRLSILDLSDKGKQPMEYRDAVIIFNGEIYNYVELRKKLTGKGYQFHTGTDTEVILAAYDAWGEKCLDMFNGMWSFLIYDKKKAILFGARDRLGVKPFYYAKIGNKFCIASEIKEFTVLDGWKSKGNKNRIYDFIAFGGIHDHTRETLFQDVFQLCPGEKLVYDLNKDTYTIDRWYDLREHIKHKSKLGDYKKDFKNYFLDSVRFRLRSDVNVGSCLSGGLDSSAIVCIMSDLLKETNGGDKQQTISACYPGKAIDEQEYIDEVINKTNVVSHKVYPQIERFLEDVDKIIWHQDEPFGSLSIYAQWEVYKAARDNDITVLLDGQGSDEYMAGYASFHKVYFRELLCRGRLIKLYRDLKRYKDKYKDYYYSPYRDLLETVIQRVIPWGIYDRLKGNLKKMRKTGIIDTYNDGLYQRMTAKKMSVREEALCEMGCSSLPKLLHHQDRDSMAHSVEARAPFLDYVLVEYVMSLPSDVKIKDAVTKNLMREALYGILPKKIQCRYDKLGFATPMDEWIRQNQELFESELTKGLGALGEFLDRNVILKKYHEAIRKRTSLAEFFRYVCVGRWIKVFHISL